MDLNESLALTFAKALNIFWEPTEGNDELKYAIQILLFAQKNTLKQVE